MTQNKKLTQRKGFWIIISIVILVFLVLFIFHLSSQIDYYKEQMLNFCEFTLIQQDIIFILDPGINLTKFDEPCSYWEIE